MQKVGREQEVSDNASTLGRLPFVAAVCIDFVSGSCILGLCFYIFLSHVVIYIIRAFTTLYCFSRIWNPSENYIITLWYLFWALGIPRLRLFAFLNIVVNFISRMQQVIYLLHLLISLTFFLGLDYPFAVMSL